MESIRVAIIGAGSVRCGIPTIASLASYFGERPLDIGLYDADEERLDLFDALARSAFQFNKNPHRVRASSDPEEILSGSTKIVFQLDENCAKLEAKTNGVKRPPKEVGITQTLGRLVHAVDNDAQVVSLLPADVHVPLDLYYRLDWPRPLSVEERRAVPHQALRWIRGEEYMVEILREHQRSPFKMWLDDASSAILVGEG